MPATPRFDQNPLTQDLVEARPLPRLASSDEYDALADLFMGEAPPASKPAASESPARSEIAPSEGAAAAPSVTIELLIMGHLPVRAAPWPAQYARILAEQSAAAITLIRLGRTTLSVDVFGAPAAAGEAVSFDHPEVALQRAMQQSSHLLVQADELDLPLIANDPRVSRVTILTGLNEAAIVAAYRTLKGLSQITQAPDSDSSLGDASLQIAFVGASREEAYASMAKLRHAASVFLGRPLHLAGLIEKVGPTGARTLYRGEGRLTPESLFEIAMTASTEVVTEPVVRSTLEDRIIESITTDPQPTAEPVATPSSLAMLIPGLQPLAARHPESPEVELALDDAGTLHLLAQDVPSGAVYEKLASAAAWAQKHASLLAMLPGAAALRQDAVPVQHLFTSTPRRVKHLLDASVKLHVVAPVSTERFVADLN